MLRRLLRNPDVPAAYRANFRNLYLDVGWFGVLSGSAVNFLNVYAARLGATPVQIGLLGAMSALVSLALAIPAGNWLQRRPVGRAVFWTSVFYRLGFVAWIFLPWLFDAPGQVQALIVLAFLMGIPLTALSVGFNALFAEAVPPDWRAHVMGVRNVVLSVTFIASSLGSGWLLDALPFPTGYQVVFAIGAFGAAMSSYHLYFVRPLAGSTPPAPPPRPRHRDLRAALRLDVWATPYRRTLLAMLAFHFAQYLAIPLFPIYMVREIGLTDQQIGVGTALFYLTVLLGSTRLARVSARLGHRRVTGLGVIGMSLYPILMSFSHNALQYYGLSVLGGFVWAMVGGASPNYVLENVPADDRPAHLAWYNLILNACVLSGSLLGPFAADHIGLATALFVFGLLRAVAGVIILRRG